MPRPIRPRRTTRSSRQAQGIQEELISPPSSGRKKRQVPVLPPNTTQGPLYETVAATAIRDDGSIPAARAVCARRSIPINDQNDNLRRTETRNIILQNYNDDQVDRLDLHELLDLLQNCMAVFDLTPTERIALLSRLTLMDATLANASMYTPPPTPVRNKASQHGETQKKRQSKFAILESAAIPPAFANASAASVAASIAPTLSGEGLDYPETWLDRRFIEVATGSSSLARSAEGEAASLLSPDMQHAVTIGSLLDNVYSWLY